MLTLDLRPLRETEALELARSLALGATAILSDCVQRSEGNPLFLEQLLRSALADDQEALPGSVQSIVLARLDRLPPRDRQAIQAASTLGQYFSLPVLRELIGDAGYTGAALIAGHLIRPMNGEYLFAHALIWEGTYASLLSDQKHQWHLAAAAWYTTRDSTLAAEHLERAGDPRAARAYLEAARAESALQHTDRTIQLLERGLRLATDRPDRIDLLAELGGLFPLWGDRLTQSMRSSVCSIWPLTISSAAAPRSASSPACACSTGRRKHSPCSTKHRPWRGRDRTPNWRRSTICAAASTSPSATLRAASPSRSWPSSMRAPPSSIELQLRALSGQADAYYASGRIVSAYEHFRECVDASRKHRFGQIEAANLPMVAFSAQLMGKFEEAKETSQAAVIITQRMGNRRAEIIAHHGCAMAHLERGEVELARTHAQAAVDMSRAIGARRFDPESVLVVAACVLCEGNRVQAAAMMREALAKAREHISYCGPMILGALARATDDPEERKRCLEEGEQILKAGSDRAQSRFLLPGGDRGLPRSARLARRAALRRSTGAPVRRRAFRLRRLHRRTGPRAGRSRARAPRSCTALAAAAAFWIPPVHSASYCSFLRWKPRWLLPAGRGTSCAPDARTQRHPNAAICKSSVCPMGVPWSLAGRTRCRCGSAI